MHEISQVDSVPSITEEMLKTEANLKEVVQAALGDEPLHNDVCHRKAVRIAKLLIEKIDLSKYQVKLVQITGHSAVSVTHLSMTSLTEAQSGYKMLINTGYPLEELPNDFYFIAPANDITALIPDGLEWIESIPLTSASDAKNAESWMIGEAKSNRQYYPN